MEDEFLPVAEFVFQRGCRFRLLLKQIYLLGRISFEIEEFTLRLTLFLLVDDKLEAAINARARGRAALLAVVV